VKPLNRPPLPRAVLLTPKLTILVVYRLCKWVCLLSLLAD
jgi:hypothetical protein